MTTPNPDATAAEAMRAVLKPFADYADFYDDAEDDTFRVSADASEVKITVGDLRRARSAIRSLPLPAAEPVSEEELSRAIEGVLFGRALRKELDGYTLITSQECARAVLALLAARSAVPAGWKLVPVEATEAMTEAHFRAHAEAKTVFADVPDIWRAILAAAPPDTKDA